MEKKIEAVQEYFRGKLLSGEFVVKEMEECICGLVVDGKYFFTIWMGNDPKYRKLYHACKNSIDLEFTENQSIDLDEILQVRRKAWKDREWRDRKVKEIERLKRELEE
jgi:hypothetical protein